MLIIDNPSYFAVVEAFARERNLYDGTDNACLKNRLTYLESYGGKRNDGTDRTRVTLSKDGAPYSFYFVVEQQNDSGAWTRCFNGGLIYHGPIDGFGSGSASTFATCLTPVHGWSVHT